MSWSTWAFPSAGLPDGKIAQRNFGGHTRDFGKKPVKRACYAADHTGRVVLDTLYDQCLRHQVRFYSEHYLLSLVFEEGRCSGVMTYDLASGLPSFLQAKAVLLATGGCGKIFKTTSNGFASTGDGFNLAFQAGIPLEDMEFIQFHPTGLYPLGILVSEAARGEGGILRNDQGERFMERYAPTIKDLAARDVVSRAILTEIREGRGIGGKDYVHLDLTHLGEKKITGETLGDCLFREDLFGNRSGQSIHPRFTHLSLRDGRDSDRSGRKGPGR